MMHFYTMSIAVLGLITAAISQTTLNFSEFPPSTDLIWHACNGTNYCAVLQVPLDYQNPSLGQAYVPLIKVPAEANSTDGPYKGMIITNPGGPGESGILDLVGSDGGGKTYRSTIGTNYDVVSFDPRGVWNSVPLANCTPSNPLHRRNENLYVPDLTESDYHQAFINATAFGERCAATIGNQSDARPHMSTAVVAQDMLRIVDAFSITKEGKSINDSAMLNYWGLSYGSFIGQTFASMFPDRVGRVVLDGIVDPEQYVTVGFGSNGLLSTDDAFSTFFLYCSLAGASNCSFWERTPEAVYDRFERLVSQLDIQNAERQHWANASSIDAALSLLKQLLFPATYSPIGNFPQLAELLVLLETTIPAGEIDAWIGVAKALLPGAPLEWVVGIYCSDANGFSYNMSFDELRGYIEALEKESVIGGNTYGLDRMQCSKWSVRGSDVFSGPSGGSPRNPILFVSNTLDPATPLPNGEKWSSKYKRAGLLTIDGVGHMSLGPMNSCAFAKIGTFFQTGVLPHPGSDSFCPLEAGPWGVETLGKLTDLKELRSVKDKMKRFLSSL